MKAMRQILANRMLATALAAVFAYLLVFQGFAGNMARASMAVSVSDPMHVMCGAAGIFESLPSEEDRPLGKSADCPCATLCRLASSAVPAVLAATILFVRPSTVVAEAVSYPRLRVSAAIRRGVLAEARGPPFIS